MSSSPLSPLEAARLSRRAFVGRMAAFGALTAAVGPLAACGDGSSGGTLEVQADVVEAASCTGYDALTPQQLSVRDALRYVDAAPTAAQHCANCRFVQLTTANAPCVGCQLIPGPISPGGWCSSWATPAV
ncbi:MAG TPA: high-potential iron-sulfur protein [Rhodothermales bacterium]|nr:high-potential iron-sulfur protein [Rhodothermales bacterium]